MPVAVEAWKKLQHVAMSLSTKLRETQFEIVSLKAVDGGSPGPSWTPTDQHIHSIPSCTSAQQLCRRPCSTPWDAHLVHALQSGPCDVPGGVNHLAGSTAVHT